MLREATAADHDAVDALFSRVSMTSRDGYARFLLAQAAAHLPVEAALERSGVGAVLPDWPERRRAEALLADLDQLGVPPPASEGAPDFASEASLLGGVYVLEGSRLGGTLLRRQLPDGYPARFLGQHNPKLWRDLCDVLDGRLVRPEARAAAVASARAVFGVFARAGERHLEALGVG